MAVNDRIAAGRVHRVDKAIVTLAAMDSVGDGLQAVPGDPTQSPTLNMMATQSGVILGTAGYMSPEQAQGKTADRRSDIWSFGVGVSELLAGRTPFEGETTVEILGAVMNKEPDWSGVPPRAEPLLRWCLEKDRRKRLAAIGDARMLLEESGAHVQTKVSEAKGRSILWPVVAAGLLLLGVVCRDGTRQSFDVSADGKRVVIFPRPPAEETDGSLHATFLVNFFDEVRRRIP